MGNMLVIFREGGEYWIDDKVAVDNSRLWWQFDTFENYTVKPSAVD